MMLYVSFFCSVLVIFYSVNVISGLQNPYCKLTCRFGKGEVQHTVCDRHNYKCGPSPNCGPDFEVVKMTESLRKLVLDLHNKFRNKIAKGLENRVEQQYPAANMRKLFYDNELEFISQCWANNCKGNPLEHDMCRRTKKHDHVGQNLGYYNSSRDDFDIDNVTETLITYWYDEVLLFPPEWTFFTDDRSPIVVGHFTQVAWANTTHVGCALSRYTSPNIHLASDPDVYPAKWHHLLLVCNYAPGGNYLTYPVYRVGEPCGECPTGTSCPRGVAKHVGERDGEGGHYSGLCEPEVDRSVLEKWLALFSPVF